MRKIKTVPLICAAVILVFAGVNASRTNAEGEQSADVMEVLNSNGNFKLFAALLNDNKLGDDFHGRTAFTLFAPTDAAFHNQPNLVGLLSDKVRLKAMLNGHMVADRTLMLSDLDKMNSLVMSNGQTVKVSPNGHLNDAYITFADLTVRNGVIHGVDDLLVTGEPQPIQISVSADDRKVEPRSEVVVTDTEVRTERPAASVRGGVERVGDDVKLGARKIEEGAKTSVRKLKGFFTGKE
jgi:uncharacterized surface protein with fasciclin (FAS1) repeats